MTNKRNETTSSASATSAAAATDASAAPRIVHRRRRSRPLRGPGLKPLPDDDMPADTDQSRLRMARRMMSFMQSWRRCDQPVCRRARRCEGRDLACLSRPDRPPLTPEQTAWAKASLHRALQRRLAEVEPEERE